MHTRTIAAALVTGVLLVAVAACSSNDTPTPVAPTTPAASSSAPVATPDASIPPAELPAPVIVEETATTADAAVGQFLDFVTTEPVNTQVSVDNPAVLAVTPGRTDGSATFNPGGQALTPGVAVVTFTNPDGTTRTLTVTVTDGSAVETPTPADPSEGGPSTEPAASETPTSGETAAAGETQAAELLCADIMSVPTNLADATSSATGQGLEVRVVVLDGVPQPATKDYNPNRVNVEVASDMIKACSVG